MVWRANATFLMRGPRRGSGCCSRAASTSRRSLSCVSAAVRALVPRQPQPVQRLVDLLFAVRDIPRPVRVLNPQHERPALLPASPHAPAPVPAGVAR